LNITHNLKESEYNFTSEAGEFNDRFEIVFQESALNINTIEIGSSDLSIVELNDGRVEFTIAKNVTIENVVILDAVGREVYQLKGNGSVEVYTLDKLTKAPYIAQVQLSNGQIITKKAIKRR
jgi:phage-related protein